MKEKWIINIFTVYRIDLTSKMEYIVLNPVFSMFKKPPVWYEYVRVDDKKSGAIYFKKKDAYELRVYGCTHSNYIKKYISLN